MCVFVETEVTRHSPVHVCVYVHNSLLTQCSSLCVSSKDQDKTRPLSTLANLAIIITDVQDMDPIFINLPYSTNIYEHSPPVSPAPSPDGGPCPSGVTVRHSGNKPQVF